MEATLDEHDAQPGAAGDVAEAQPEGLDAQSDADYEEQQRHLAELEAKWAAMQAEAAEACAACRPALVAKQRVSAACHR